MYSNLTPKQQQILRLTAVGLSAKEVAEETGATTNTINTHLKNIKERLGLQKSTELVAYYWCEIFGSSLEDQRKQIISTIMIILFFYSVPLMEDKKTRNQDRRNQKIEISIRGRRKYS